MVVDAISGITQGLGGIIGGLGNLGVGSKSRKAEMSVAGDQQAKLAKIHADAQGKAAQSKTQLIFIGFAVVLIGFILFKALK